MLTAQYCHQILGIHTKDGMFIKQEFRRDSHKSHNSKPSTTSLPTPKKK